jgi:hypothetical protein
LNSCASAGAALRASASVSAQIEECFMVHPFRL